MSAWNAFSQSAELVRELHTPLKLPVRLVTALNTYYEQPLPAESPVVTTETWFALQNDLWHLSLDSEETLVEDATHFSLFVNPNHAVFVSETIITLVESTR